MREAPVSQHAILYASQLGVLTQRNNVGACVDSTGRMIRYGLLNESKKQNDEIKSSDHICITPVTITPEMVGMRIGVYTALETKHSDWHLTPGDKRGQAQQAYHQLVKVYGGYAGFVTCNADVRQIIGLK